MRNSSTNIEFKYNDAGIRTQKELKDQNGNPISTTNKDETNKITGVGMGILGYGAKKFTDYLFNN